MKYGVGLNINETVREIVRKSMEIERLGFDYIWVADAPSQRYSPAVASAIAEGTHSIRIGLGLLSPLLHTPDQIFKILRTLIDIYGERFELCIGPGDIDQLKRVGIRICNRRKIPGLLLRAREEIAEKLQKNGLEVSIWLGAQGPRVLELAKFFDGVLLNYAQPIFVDWAIERMGLQNKYSTTIGVYAPSYVYQDLDEELCELIRFSAATVVLGAPERVLKEFGLYENVAKAKNRLEEGLMLEAVFNEIPNEILEMFAIHLHSNKLRSYIQKLKNLGVEHIVFGYPQALSREDLEILAKSLFD